MEKIKWVFMVLCTISLLFFAIGCDGGPGPGGGCDGGTGSSSSSSSSTSTSSGSSSSSSGSMILDRTHNGWLRANCTPCHPGDSHNTGMKPYECVDCHGNNGATRVAHGNNCQSCHRMVPGHPAASFPYNTSCVECHQN